MDYTVNAAGNAAWNLLAAAIPGVGGPQIEHPAVNAGQYLYFAMDGFLAIEAGGPYQGAFTTSLCGCIAGFLVRMNGGQIRRIVGYHQTATDNTARGAVALFNAAGPNGPQPGEVNFLIRPDKASYAAGFPAAIQALIDGNTIPAANVHTYLRNAGANVSWVVSLNGDLGEMSAAFAATLSAAQTATWGAQAIPVIPAAADDCHCCCVIS